MRRTIRGVTAAALVAAALPAAVLAQQGAAAPVRADTLALAGPTADDLDQRIRVLERRLELEREAATAAAASATAPTITASGVQFRAADGSFVARFRGYVHQDGRFFDGEGPTGASTFLLRRVRPIVEGTVFRHYDYRVMTDFGGGSAVLQDAYVDVTHLPWARVRAGKFKPPVGLERLQSATGILFVERALPTNLVPNRDVGVQLWGDLRSGTISYALGVFNGVADGGSADADVNDGKDVAARLFVTPLRFTGAPAFQNVGVGIAASTGNQSGATATSSGLGAQRSPFQQSVFTYRSAGTLATTARADGRRTRLSPQGYAYWGRAGLLAEYVVSRNEVRLDQHAAELEHRAWLVQGSYVLFGGNAAFAGVRPLRDFEPRANAWGALELKGRIHALDLDDATFPTYADPARSVASARAWAAGLNWHLNQNVKVALDYQRTEFEGGAASGADRPAEQGLLTRLQLAF